LGVRVPWSYQARHKTPRLHAAIAQADWERAQVVDQNLQYSVEDWEPNLDEASLRRDSTTLRLLLIDGTYARAWTDIARAFCSLLGRLRQWSTLACSTCSSSSETAASCLSGLGVPSSNLGAPTGKGPSPGLFLRHSSPRAFRYCVTRQPGGSGSGRSPKSRGRSKRLSFATCRDSSSL
jgi:hypothetical protein